MVDLEHPNGHVVLAAVPAYGHVRPLRALAKGFAQRGYRVTFITGETFRASMEAIEGVRFVPLTGKADFDTDRLDEQFPEREDHQGLAKILYDQTDIVWAAMADQFDVVQTVLRKDNVMEEKSVILADGAFVGNIPMLLGSKSAIRVPTIGIGHYPLLVSSKDTAPFGSGLPSQGEEKNLAMNADMDALFRPATLDIREKLKPFHCDRDFPSGFPTAACVPLQDLFAQLCVPSLEPARSDLSPNIRFFGMPLGANEKPSALPGWWDEFVLRPTDPAHPLIVVTSGTLPACKLTDLIGPTIAACATLPVRLLVCGVHVQEPSSALPQNVRWARWIPFEDLFPRTDILISSGGYGGISQAFASGIPLVLAGLTEDKIESNARAAMTGAAINLKVQTASEQQVREAVEQILKDSKYRRRALELQKEYASCDALANMVSAVEELRQKFYGDAEQK